VASVDDQRGVHPQVEDPARDTKLRQRPIHHDTVAVPAPKNKVVMGIVSGIPPRSVLLEVDNFWAGDAAPVLHSSDVLGGPEDALKLRLQLYAEHLARVAVQQTLPVPGTHLPRWLPGCRLVLPVDDPVVVGGLLVERGAVDPTLIAGAGNDPADRWARE
jgi:hypothetical protein